MSYQCIHRGNVCFYRYLCENECPSDPRAVDDSSSKDFSNYPIPLFPWCFLNIDGFMLSPHQSDVPEVLDPAVSESESVSMVTDTESLATEDMAEADPMEVESILSDATPPQQPQQQQLESTVSEAASSTTDPTPYDTATVIQGNSLPAQVKMKATYVFVVV